MVLNPGSSSSSRPQLKAALALCRITRATLVIARLDRLSRSVELITGLMESGLDFVAVDFPEATRFTIHILAAVAEYKSEIQSERMKAMNAARRLRKTNESDTRRTWTRRFPDGCQTKSARIREARADARALDLSAACAEGSGRGKILRGDCRRIQQPRDPAAAAVAVEQQFGF